jgi:hypothetical protein
MEEDTQEEEEEEEEGREDDWEDLGSDRLAPVREEEEGSSLSGSEGGDTEGEESDEGEGAEEAAELERGIIPNDGLVEGTGGGEDPDNADNEEWQEQETEGDGFLDPFMVQPSLHNCDKSWVEETYGHWIGCERPLNAEMSTVMVNTGGCVVPRDSKGNIIPENRLQELCRLVALGKASMAISVESHLDDEGARNCVRWLGETPEFEDCKLECCPASNMGSAITEAWNKDDEDVKQGTRTGPAGIVVVMSKELKRHRRGKATTKACGRLMHMVFGNGATETEDTEKIHYVIVYGVSNPSNKHKQRLSETVYNELDGLLTKIKREGANDKIVVCGDINTVKRRTDRRTNAMRTDDKTDYAPWKVLVKHGLEDIMEAVCQGAPPMTYVPGHVETSRIDVVYTNFRGIKCATATKMGPLSKTHRPVAWSLPGVKLAKGKINPDIEQAVAVIRTGSAPNRWHLSEAAQQRYTSTFSVNGSIKKNFEEAEEALKDSLTGAKDAAAAAEAWCAFFKNHCSILVAAAELARRETGANPPEPGPKRAKEGAIRDIVELCQSALKDYAALNRERSRGRFEHHHLSAGNGRGSNAGDDKKRRSIMKKIAAIAVRLDVPDGLPPRQAREEGQTEEGAATYDTWNILSRIEWVKGVLRDKEQALVGLGWTRVGENFVKQRKGANERQQMKDEDVLKAAKDPSKTKAGGPLEGMLIEGIYESGLEGLAEHVQAVQEEYTVAHWHSRMMKEILVEDETGDARATEEAIARSLTWKGNLNTLKKALIRRLQGRMDGPTIADAAELAGTQIAANIIENIEEKDDPSDLEQSAARELVTNKITEIELMVNELQKVDRIAELLNSRAAPENKREEVEAAYIEALAPPTTPGEVRNMFRRLPSGKTGGKSGCCREHYIHAPDKILASLIPLIEEIFKGTSPDILRLGVINPLYKDSSSFRPITLLEPIWKACQARVSDRCFQVAVKYNLLNDNQYAFVPGGCTEDPLEIMTSVFQDSRANNKPCHAAFLDMKSAYDTVPAWAVQVALRRLGAPLEFSKWAVGSMTGHQRIVQVRSGTSTKSFSIGGLPQGCNLSPYLFCVVADLALAFAEQVGGQGYSLLNPGEDPELPMGANVQAQAYADDLSTLSDSKEGLQTTVQAMVTILSCFNLRVSPAKCVYAWSQAAHAQPLPEANLEGLRVERRSPGGSQSLAACPIANNGAGKVTGTTKRGDSEPWRHQVLWEGGETKEYSTEEVWDMVVTASIPKVAVEVDSVPTLVNVEDTKKGNGPRKWKLTLGLNRKATKEYGAEHLGRALARAQRGALEFVGLGVDGTLRRAPCTPCAPVRRERGHTVEARGGTKYLGVILSFTGWAEEKARIQGKTSAFFQRMVETQPTLRQFKMLMRSLLTSALNYNMQVFPSNVNDSSQLQTEITVALGKILGLRLYGGGRTVALAVGSPEHGMAGAPDPTAIIIAQDLKSILKGMETKNPRLAAALKVAVRKGLQPDGSVKSQEHMSWWEIYDTVISRLRSLERLGIRIHQGGGERLTKTADEARKLPPAVPSKYQMDGTETERQFRDDVEIAILPIDYVFVPVQHGKPFNEDITLEGSTDIFAAITMAIAGGPGTDVAVVDTTKITGTSIYLSTPEERALHEIKVDSALDFRCAMRQSVLLTPTTDQDAIAVVKAWAKEVCMQGRSRGGEGRRETSGLEEAGNEAGSGERPNDDDQGDNSNGDNGGDPHQEAQQAPTNGGFLGESYSGDDDDDDEDDESDDDDDDVGQQLAGGTSTAAAAAAATSTAADSLSAFEEFAIFGDDSD